MINSEELTAFIFAAGLGTRLKPLTDTMPKALVPVAGRPLIDHVIEALKSQGTDRFVVNVHHFAGLIRCHIAERSDAAQFLISDETDLLRETGGAIRHAATLLGDRHFLVHNVDIISNFDLQLMARNIRPEALATLLVSERVTHRYLLFDDEMRLVGWTNMATGEVKSPYPGLDPDKCRKLAFAGIHILSSAVHELMRPYPERFSIIDFYLDQCAHHPIYGYVQPGLRMIDVGKLDSLDEADKLIAEIAHLTYIS